MSRERVELHREQETMLMTLYLHARDAESRRPILGDRYAAPLLERIDYDFGRLARLTGNLPVIVSRAKAVDNIVRSFLAEHDDPVVLHLGCGVDSRVQRIDPGPNVAWFDIDQQPVIDLRRRLVENRDGVTMLGTSVTEPQWWATIPAGRPTLVIGEGLLMYLTADDVRVVVDAALTRSHAPVRMLVFDTVAPWVRCVSGWQPNFRDAGAKFLSTTSDLTDAVRHHAGVTMVDEQSLVPLARHASSGPLRAFVGALAAWRFGRRAMVLQTFC